MTKKKVEKNTATKTETAVKPKVASTPSGSTFPVFPAKLRSKTEEFCNEFETIQLLKKRKMTTTGIIIKGLLDDEIEVRKKLLDVFKKQVEFLLDDATEHVNKELA